MGDDTSIHCYKDPWVPGSGPLLSFPAHTNLDLDCTLSDLVLPDGSWDLDLFCLWLPEEMIQRIVSIPPPHPFMGHDRVIWSSFSSRGFSVRSAYWALQQNSWNPNDDH